MTYRSLVGTEYAPCNQHYVHRKGITVHTVPVPANEVPAIKTPNRVVNWVLTVIMSTKNHPILVHCSDGQVSWIHLAYGLLSVSRLISLIRTAWAA